MKAQEGLDLKPRLAQLLNLFEPYVFIIQDCVILRLVVNCIASDSTLVRRLLTGIISSLAKPIQRGAGRYYGIQGEMILLTVEFLSGIEGPMSHCKVIFFLSSCQRTLVNLHVTKKGLP